VRRAVVSIPSTLRHKVKVVIDPDAPEVFWYQPQVGRRSSFRHLGGGIIGQMVGTWHLICVVLVATGFGTQQPQNALGLPVRGVVRDQTGAILRGATVEIVAESGATIATSTTDANGEFRFDSVPAGAYQLQVRLEGFRPHSTPLRLSGRRAPPAQAVVLDLAAVPQDVTVNAGDDVIAATAAANRDAVGIDDAGIRNIPVFDRDVVATLGQFLDASSLGSGGPSLVVDGMEARKVGVSPAAIQSIKVNQDPYSAEFPRPGRGRIEVVTKAGTDAYHGSFDFTFRDAALNARDPFAPTTPPEQRRIYEGVLGGPVLDRTRNSFLFTVERREEDLQAIVYAASPTGLINEIVPRPDRSTEISASLNHQQGRSNTLFVRVTSEVNNNRNSGVGGTTLAEAGTNDHGDEEQVIVGARTILTPRVLSEFRWLGGREISSTASVNPGRHLVVLDAFADGGAQADQSTSEYHFNLTENLTYVHGRHLLKGARYTRCCARGKTGCSGSSSSICRIRIRLRTAVPP
jgi:hypothetical protein